MRKKETLWVKWIHGVNLKDVSFWDCAPTSDSSWYWGKLHGIKVDMAGWYINER